MLLYGIVFLHLKNLATQAIQEELYSVPKDAISMVISKNIYKV
jgi:hypothetical protein